jgi:alkanesulfonate monooxygenase SsuD/methylene tetrahydromethanopterin reductase-like flavin-dependent oxidoreductase (luciferase family)
MQFGSFMEFHVRPGRPQAEAFAEGFAHVRQAEEQGLDGVWLAETHFTPERALTSSPLILASAIAGMTKRMRVGTAVLLLPIRNPLEMAEEVATLDHASQGRFEFGVGRSSAPGSYEGYGVFYGESKDRLYEALDVMRLAWTQDRFSYHGKFYDYDDVCLTPKPLQQPYPFVRVAATTDDSFVHLGEMGLPIFIGLRTSGLPKVRGQVQSYVKAWREAGHGGEPDVSLRVPVYVADTERAATSDPEASFMRQFKRLSGQLSASLTAAGADQLESRLERAQGLQSLDWQQVLNERVAVGTPEMVVERIDLLRDTLQINTVVGEFNAGEQLPAEKIERSLQLFCEKVIPAFR